MMQTSAVLRQHTPAILVADYITALGNGMFTPLQVIKLAYMSHGYVLALTSKPLFRDRIEAWEYGPMIPALFEALRVHGKAPIPRLYACRTPMGSDALGKRRDELAGLFNANQRAIIEKVVSTYGDYAPFQLSYICHMDGSPWRIVIDKDGTGTEIDDEILRSYYKEQSRAPQPAR